MKNPSIAFVLVVGSIVGCGEMPDATDDESVTEVSALLPTTTPFKLHNYQTGLCLGVAAGTPTVGTSLITWTCDNSANQTWIQIPKTQYDWETVLIKNYVADNRCMDVTNNLNGGQGRINYCMNGSTELPGWQPIYAGPDLNNHACYRLHHQGAGLYRALGVSGGNTNKGAQTILWTDFDDHFNHPDQYWCVY